MNKQPISKIALASFIISGSGLLTWVTLDVIYYRPARAIAPSVNLILTTSMAISLVLALVGAWKTSAYRLRGWTFAFIAFFFAVFGLAVGYLTHLGRIMRVTTAWHRVANDLRFVTTAMQDFHVEHDHLPHAIVKSADGSPLFSWRVSLLPYLETDEVFKKFKLNEPWDSPLNMPLSRTTLPEYRPLRGSQEKGVTYFQVFVGGGALFDEDDVITFAELEKGDGFAHTFMIAEAGQPVPWSKPQDLPYDPDKPLPALGRHWEIPRKYRFGEAKFGFHASFADGSVRFFSEDTDEKVLRALITRDGGELIDLEDF